MLPIWVARRMRAEELLFFRTFSSVVQTLIPVSPVFLVPGIEYRLMASAEGDTIDIWNATVADPNVPTALNHGSGGVFQSRDRKARDAAFPCIGRIAISRCINGSLMCDQQAAHQ
jgi:hypothetical protein